MFDDWHFAGLVVVYLVFVSLGLYIVFLVCGFFSWF